MDTNQRTPQHKPALAIFATVGSLWVFVLVTLGAFTTSIGAGMAFPDWPLSNGSINPLGWLEDLSMFAEHSHRLTGALMGLITVTLAIWLWRREDRPWLRQLGWWALAIVSLQGVIGGQRVKLIAIAVPGLYLRAHRNRRRLHEIVDRTSRPHRGRRAPIGNPQLCPPVCSAHHRRHHAPQCGGARDPHFPLFDGRPPLAARRVEFPGRHPLRPPRDGRGARTGVDRTRFRGAPRSRLDPRDAGAQIIWTFRRAEMTTSHVVVGALTLATTFWLTWLAHRDALESRAWHGRLARELATTASSS